MKVNEMADEAKRPRGRPSIPAESRKRNNVTMRLRDDTKLKLEFEAAAHQRSLSEEMEARLEQSFVDAAYPPEIAALAEFLARAMTETGDFISNANRAARHGFEPWLSDRYAYNQATEAAIRVLQQSLYSGNNCEPWGIFAAPPFSEGLAQQVGVQNADGLLQAMRGREPGTSADLWLPRLRPALGAIGDRLVDHPEPDEYFAPSTTKPVRVLMVPTAEEGVFDLKGEVVDEGGQAHPAGDEPAER